MCRLPLVSSNFYVTTTRMKIDEELKKVVVQWIDDRWVNRQPGGRADDMGQRWRIDGQGTPETIHNQTGFEDLKNQSAY